MLKSCIWLVICIVFVINTLEVLGQRPTKCAAIDEYCQIHSDCCSNSCLTYLYRCTRNYSGVYPYAFFGEKYPATGTIEDVMAFTFSNFGSVEEMRKHQNAHQPQRQRPNGFSSRFSDTGIGGELNYLNDEARETETTTVAGTTDGVPKATTSSQSVQMTTNNDSKIESDNVAVQTRVSEDTAECKGIGLKCFNNNECCSKRCHGFLHQCVT